MQWPFEPFKIDEGFGGLRSYGYHSGLDLNGPSGGNTDCNTTLKPLCAGQHTFSSLSDRGYGNIFVYEIVGPWGKYYVRYCHLNAFNPLNCFSKDAIVGYMGSTGNSTACHLHLDIFIKQPPHWRFSATTKEQLDEYFTDPITFMETYKNIGSESISMTEETESSIYKGLDLTNKESMKVAVDVWARFATGGEELVAKTLLDKLREDSKQLEKYKERLKGIEATHEQEIIALKQQAQQNTEDETLRLKSQLKDADNLISNLRQQMLNNQGDWKARFLSRKFVLSAATALFDLAVAIAVLFGAKPDPMALGQVLAALHTAVGVFAIPEAISDHQERMTVANKIK